ncbi:MAG: pre-peptidase C-terminal domain-containing protein, partial [Planctomycetes bacterium]|nr:pre-peptidase C-terminal domain-containing protein [Planctomycetota bacterium]
MLTPRGRPPRTRHALLDTRLYLRRLEDRRVLSVAPVDVGDTLIAADETGVGPGSGTFSATEELGDGATGNRDVDLFRFQASAGSTLTAETSQPSGAAAVDTVLRLFDSLGNELDFNDDRDFLGGDFYSQIDFTFATDGTYFIGVSGFGNDFYDAATGGGTAPGETGDYLFTLSVTAEPGNTLVAAEDTGLNGAGIFHRNESLAGIDIDLYRFQAGAGDTLLARTEQPGGSSDSVNTLLRLFDASGNQLDFDDDDGPGLYSELNFTFTTAGTYYLGVSAFPQLYYNPTDGSGTFAGLGDAGDYRLTISFDGGGTIANAEATGIGPSGGSFSIVEALANPGIGSDDVDLYRFEATAGQLLTAETFQPIGAASTVDTGLRLFDSLGNELEFNDDLDPLGGDFYSRLEFTFATAGTYFVGVSGFENYGYDPLTAAGAVAGDTGNYRLQLNVGTPPTDGEIRGTVFVDANGNGVCDGAETGQAGVTVFLDNDGVAGFSLGDTQSVTDAVGFYSFIVTPGTYT